MQNQKGNTTIIILIALVLVIGALFFITNNQDQTPDLTTTQQVPAPGSKNVEEKTVTNQQESDITIENFSFSPKKITVKPGQEISIINQDTVQHNVASNDGTAFKTELLAKGESTTFIAPQKPGEYPFHCTPHPFMQATLIVKE